MNFGIKRLTESDLIEVVDLLDCLGKCFEEPDVYCQNQPSIPYFESVLEDPSNIILSLIHI